MLSSLYVTILLGCMLGVFTICILISLFVIYKYYQSLKKLPREIVEISHDGYVYKLADGDVLSVFKMKKKIAKGYIYWFQSKDNIIKYSTLIDKINSVANEHGKTDFIPEPYYKQKKFKVDL